MTTVHRTTVLFRHLIDGVDDVIHFRHEGQEAQESAAGIAVTMHPADWIEMGSPESVAVTLATGGHVPVAEPAPVTEPVAALDQPATPLDQPAFDHTAALPVPMNPPTEGS